MFYHNTTSQPFPSIARLSLLFLYKTNFYRGGEYRKYFRDVRGVLALLNSSPEIFVRRDQKVLLESGSLFVL